MPRLESSCERRFPVPPVTGNGERLVVVRGDSLWNTTRARYGNGFRHTLIYGASKDQIRDPDLMSLAKSSACPGKFEQNLTFALTVSHPPGCEDVLDSYWGRMRDGLVIITACAELIACKPTYLSAAALQRLATSAPRHGDRARPACSSRWPSAGGQVRPRSRALIGEKAPVRLTSARA